MLDAKNENRVKLISKADVNFNTVIIYVDLFNYFLMCFRKEKIEKIPPFVLRVQSSSGHKEYSC